jgi:hypothetical protein
MKLTPTACRRSRRGQRAWALLAVMSLSAAGLMVLAGVMSWADQNSANTARNNEYFTTSYAAEAATEKVLAKMAQDFQNYGFNQVYDNMSAYPLILPGGSANDGTCWADYQFSAGSAANQIIVTNVASSNTIVMGAPFTGLTMVANTYEIIATARNTNSMYQIPATVGQQLYFGYIPLFQFAIFYQDNLEIEPNVAMTVTGTVHCNSNIYIAPQNGITFSNGVTASGQIILGATTPTDPITFDSFDLSGVEQLNLPVGTNTTGTDVNVSQDAYGILQLPQAGATPGSLTGSNLLYNQADMIIIISNNGTVSVTSGAGVNGQATAITNWQVFMSTNGTFEDQRDSLTVNPVTINVSNLVAWSATNSVLRPVLSGLRGAGEADVQSIYVDDLRSFTNMMPVFTTNTTWITNTTTITNITCVTNHFYTTNTGIGTPPPLPNVTNYVAPPLLTVVTNPPPSVFTYRYFSKVWSEVIITNFFTNFTTNVITNFVPELAGQPGIVLSNGAVLPPQGLAIATPDPAYIIGNWNVKSSTNAGAPSDAGLQDTTDALPSAIYADAITVLSSAWNSANSTQPIANRNAVDDTVNAAFLTGNVPTTGANPDEYSGGVENLPRLLENWTNHKFTYNGSMVCMFNSQIATAPYPGTGSVFQPPQRDWAFDLNFNNPNKQPPMMPKVIMVQRNQWVSLAPNTTSF